MAAHPDIPDLDSLSAEDWLHAFEASTAEKEPEDARVFDGVRLADVPLDWDQPISGAFTVPEDVPDTFIANPAKAERMAYAEDRMQMLAINARKAGLDKVITDHIYEKAGVKADNEAEKYDKERLVVARKVLEAVERIDGYDGKKAALLFEGGEDTDSAEVRYRILRVLGIDLNQFDNPIAEYVDAGRPNRLATVRRKLGKAALATWKFLNEDADDRMDSAPARKAERASRREAKKAGEMPPTDNRIFPYDRIRIFESNGSFMVADVTDDIYNPETNTLEKRHTVIIGPRTLTDGKDLFGQTLETLERRGWNDAGKLAKQGKRYNVGSQYPLETTSDYQERVFRAALATETLYGWDGYNFLQPTRKKRPNDSVSSYLNSL